MYKIYNNEIKISQFLKGGSRLYQHLFEDKVYESLISREGNKKYTLNLDSDVDFKLVKPFFGVPIDFKNFDEKMYNAIIFTLDMFNDLKDQYFSKPKMKEKKDDKKRENIIILAISTFKEIGLFDHNKNKFIEFDTFVKSIVSEKYITKEGDNYKFNFKDMLDNPTNQENDLVAFLTVVLAPEVQHNLPMMGGSVSIISDDPDPQYTLKDFYDDYKKLYEPYEGSLDCKKIYFRQVFNDTLIPHKVNQRFINMSGGNYSQLEYLLNGGSINTIVRIPKLSEYFKSQLRYIESKLKANNKSLSQNSRTDIQQIIDSLDKHEQKLRDQFELLKSAHLVDNDVINVELDKDKIKEAKKSLNKHKRYSGAFGDILYNLEIIANKISNDTKLTTKPFDILFN